MLCSRVWKLLAQCSPEPECNKRRRRCIDECGNIRVNPRREEEEGVNFWQRRSSMDLLSEAAGGSRTGAAPGHFCAGTVKSSKICLSPENGRSGMGTTGTVWPAVLVESRDPCNFTRSKLTLWWRWDLRTLSQARRRSKPQAVMCSVPSNFLQVGFVVVAAADNFVETFALSLCLLADLLNSEILICALLNKCRI